MQIVLPHKVEYLVEGTVSVEDVIGTLQAQQRLIADFGDLLETVLDGITVEKVELRVRSIKSGSLTEAFFVALFLAYQTELQDEIPAMIESLLGVAISDEYDTLVTVGVLVLIYYGANYAYKRLTDHLGSERLDSRIGASFR